MGADEAAAEVPGYVAVEAAAHGFGAVRQVHVPDGPLTATNP